MVDTTMGLELVSMTSTSDELLPCPFCGGSGQRVKHSGRWGWFVSCACAAVGPSSETREQAVARWNERSEPVQQRLFGGERR